MNQMTKQQALTEFRCLWADSVSYDPALRRDNAAKREAFSDFVKLLNQQRLVSDHQVYTWSNPF